MRGAFFWALAAMLAAGCGEDNRDVDDTALTGITQGGDDTSGGADDGSEPKLDLADDSATGSDPTDDPTTCDEDVDIVFVMDVSTSMGPFLDKLAQEIVVVDQFVQTLDLPNPPQYGLVVFVDDFALLMAGAPYPDVATLQADFQSWSAFTASNEQTAGGNPNTTWPENSLDALHAAATGFQWRADTLRMIIHTTDDTFWDGPTTGNGVPITHGFDEVVDTLQQNQIRVFSFTALIGGSCECEDVTPGWSTPYMGRDPMPTATDGDIYDLDQVLVGQVSLSDSINGAIEDKMCVPYPPQG